MPSNPASTPPVHAIFGSRLTTIEARLTALEVWIRTYGSGVGPWTELETVNASLKPLAEWEAPEVRQEQDGARAFLKGVYENTAELAVGAKLFTVPVAFRPKAKVACIIGVDVSGVFKTYPCPVTTAGVVELREALKEKLFIYLDGANWNLT
jgi:hypothetical protein